ncbi:MAG: T9SS type A sorting domain-containing protein, partial [Bacteroidota bacterium]
NVVKIEEYSNLPITAVTAISVSGTDISVSGQSSQMAATVLPADATFSNVVWSVDNTDVAVISATGVLTPVGNGTVVVTATSAQNTAVFGTATVNVSNQNTQFYISGTATENGNNAATALPMHMVTGPNGAITNVFEIYTSLTEAGTLNFYNAQGTGATIYGAGATAGTIAAAGAAIDPTPAGPVWITVNVATGTYTITPINWSVVGSSIANGWSGDAPLTYQGNSKWSATLDMTVVGTDANPRFVFRANQNWGIAMKKVVGSQHSVFMESQAGEFGITLQDIDLKYGNFTITLDLSNYTYGIECVAIDEYEISFMGSSGMNGQGATNMQGYAYQYNQMLQARATNGSSPFYRSNISVNGNNTTTALARWEKDLVGDCSSYVIFGLVLGNEGIHETGQVAFNSYLNNLPMMVQMARDINKVPVVQNNYGRGDFNAADYEYIKQMNILMAQWDVPSSNLLGAMDNGTGNWVDGYWDDALHPNTPGHAELFYAMVPSLFDALEAEKPQPVLTTNTFVTPAAVNGGQLVFTPDNMIHPFTVSFDVQTTGNGHLMAFTTNGTAVGNLAITTDGFVSYTSPAGTTITGSTAVNDGAWHKVTLTHYYAWGKTLLYTDATASGSVTEQLEAKVFSLNGAGAPANVNYRNWFFYRSGMNALEIAAMNENKMLKSSLELYAPLDKDAEGAAAMFANLAQSTNAIDATTFVPALGTDTFGQNSLRAYPNPVKELLTIAVPDNVPADSIEVFNTLGMLVKTAKNTDSISFSALQSGVYIVKVHTGTVATTIKVVKE